MPYPHPNKYLPKSILITMVEKKSILLLAAAYATPVGELIVNGGFDAVPSCQGSWCNYPVSQEALIAPWKVVGGDNFEIDYTAWPAHSPNYSLDLNSDTQGGFSQLLVKISQEITTVPGTEYILTFALKGNSCGPNIKTGLVEVVDYANSLTLLSAPFSHDVSQGNNWRTVSFTFVASSELTAVSIGSTTSGTSCGPVIDSVSVVGAPNVCYVRPT
ncbi:hypothetical protein HDV02_002011 [Globomyces sp. JEL0801]|nr:hypothetical protein HDV02_002011 [Globomyces sp. JEL0801]